LSNFTKLVLAALTTSAMALVPTYSGAATPAQIVAKVTHGQMKLVQTMKGPSANLTGLLAESPSGQKALAWLVDGQYLFIGPAFNSNGKSITKTALYEAGLLKKPLAPAVVSAKMLASKGFTIGTKGPLLAAFLDPNCIFCHKLWDMVYPLAERGVIRVKIVPVGFLKPSSIPIAATVMQSKNPEAKWVANEKNFNVGEELGGVVPDKVLNPADVAIIKSNTSLLASSGPVSTPSVAYCYKGKVLLSHGLTPNLTSALTSKNLGSISDSGRCKK
jgi:thiol:disulfide interchange protein DsbG